MELKDNCSVCRISMLRKPVIRLSPCSHLLHAQCAVGIAFAVPEDDDVLPIRRCPNCRTAIENEIPIERKVYKKYTNQDRERIVASANKGEDWVSLCNQLNVPYKSAYNWVRSGSDQYQTKGGKKKKILSRDQVGIIIEWVEDDCTLTLKQIKAKIQSTFNIQISISTIGNYLEGQMYSMKNVHKEPINLNNMENKTKRAEYVQALNNFIEQGKQIVWMDESNFNLFCRRSRGRSKVGMRAIQQLPVSKGPNVHLIGAISAAGVVAVERRRGSFTSALANEWVAQLINQWQEMGNLPSDLVIVLDNAPCHANLEQVIDPSPATLLRLPPYSPMLNPMETIWSKIKAYVKRHLRVPEVVHPGVMEQRDQEEQRWKLSHHENFLRMRLKLCPNLHFSRHTDASNLRDNTGWLSRMRSEEVPLSINISSAAVRGDFEDADFIPEEDLRSLTEAEVDGEAEAGKEKLLLSQDCHLVSLMAAVKGRFDITTTHIYFHDLSPVKEDTDRQDFKWHLSSLREIYLRRFNLRRSALEIFLIDQTNYFLNFTTKTRNRVVSRLLGLRPPNLSYSSSRSPADLLRASGLTHKWLHHEISNFEYLMQLNTIAGRSYNDLSQYPVFPWIIADYSSEELDLSNPVTFRDLSKPIGVVNPRNEADVKMKYDSFEDPSGTIAKFHYGTHYSNSAGVLHYLVRVEPFTSLHVELQSGRFDVADRQFHSIPQTWKLLMDNPNDVKELIPEFFYFPEFLKNLNKFDLGLLQGTKERVNDVALPKWASSAEDFIYKHRKALESEYVSAHLHEWIDLIFGYKQKGPKAVEALNVFYYCSYEGAVDLDAITNPVEREAVEGMINNFGQTPSQLMKEPHPARLSQSDALSRMLKNERKPDITLFLSKLTPVSVEVSTENDPIVFLSGPRSPPRGFLQAALPDCLVSVSRSGVVGLHSWLPYDKYSSRNFTFEIDPTMSNPKTRRSIAGSFHPSVTLHSQLFCLSHDGKMLITAGHWDCSVRVFSLTKNKTLVAAIRHYDLVTCVALDQCSWYLVSGSNDCTCIVWDISQLGSAPLKPIQTLYGHNLPVTTVAIATELDMVASGSKDGTVNIHTIQDGQYLRTLRPVGCDGAACEITFLTISAVGQIAFTANSMTNNSVHAFSVNGESLGSKYMAGRVTGLATSGDCLVAVDDAGDLTMSRLLGLYPVFDIPLHIPVQDVVVAPGNSHLLVPLQDGNIVIICVPSS